MVEVMFERIDGRLCRFGSWGKDDPLVAVLDIIEQTDAPKPVPLAFACWTFEGDGNGNLVPVRYERIQRFYSAPQRKRELTPRDYQKSKIVQTLTGERIPLVPARVISDAQRQWTHRHG